MVVRMLQASKQKQQQTLQNHVQILFPGPVKKTAKIARKTANPALKQNQIHSIPLITRPLGPAKTHVLSVPPPIRSNLSGRVVSGIECM